MTWRTATAPASSTSRAAAFDPDAFAAFLGAQRDLGPKWVPTFVRVVGAFPMTETNKVLKRELVRERFDTRDPIWWRPDRDLTYVPLDPKSSKESLEAS